MRFIRLQSIVLQATLLYAFGSILTHEIYKRWDQSVFDDPVLKNYTAALDAHSKLPGGLIHDKDDPSSQLTLPGAPLVNGTLIDDENNNNGTSRSDDKKKEKSFYTNELPKKVVVNALFTILLYYWHLLLEYLLPTRPSAAGKLNEKSAADGLEPREEELMKSLIEKGKVRRSSISWGNTFLKWFIEMTLGTLWQEAFDLFVYDYLFLENNDFLKSGVFQLALTFIFSCVGTFLSHQHIASLFAFIVVPAPQRPVFKEGTDVLASIFFAAASQIIFKGVVKSKFAQDWMLKATATQLELNRNQGGTQRGRLIDEL